VLRCQWLFFVNCARRWKKIAETCSSGDEWVLRLRESTLKKILAFVMDLWETGRHNLEICVLRSIIHEPERFCTARATVSVQRATMLRSMKKHLTWNYSDCVDIYFGVIPCLVTCVAKLSRDKVKPVYTDQQVHDSPPPFQTGFFWTRIFTSTLEVSQCRYDPATQTTNYSRWAECVFHAFLSTFRLISSHFCNMNFQGAPSATKLLDAKGSPSASSRKFFFSGELHFAGFRFPSRCKWDLRSSGVSRSVEW